MKQGVHYPDDFRSPEHQIDLINALIQEAVNVFDGQPGMSCHVSAGDLSVQWDADLGKVRVWRLVATAHYAEGGQDEPA